MARLDVYENGANGYFLDVQADIVYGLTTRLVVPLMPPGIAPIPAKRLNPIFKVGRQDHVMVTQYLAAIPTSALGPRVGNLRDQHDTVVTALDMIFLGF